MTYEDTIMAELSDLTERLTGKQVRFKPKVWYQTEEEITVPDGDFVGLMHEVCHWVVASDDEKEDGNLRLVNGRGESIYRGGRTVLSTKADLLNSIKREKQACFLEMSLAIDAQHTIEDLLWVAEIQPQYGKRWWERLNKQSKAGYKGFLTKTYKRYPKSLRGDMTDLMGRYLSWKT